MRCSLPHEFLIMKKKNAAEIYLKYKVNMLLARSIGKTNLFEVKELLFVA